MNFSIDPELISPRRKFDLPFLVSCYPFDVRSLNIFATKIRYYSSLFVPGVRLAETPQISELTGSKTTSARLRPPRTNPPQIESEYERTRAEIPGHRVHYYRVVAVRRDETRRGIFAPCWERRREREGARGKRERRGEENPPVESFRGGLENISNTRQILRPTPRGLYERL